MKQDKLVRAARLERALRGSEPRFLPIERHPNRNLVGASGLEPLLADSKSAFLPLKDIPTENWSQAVKLNHVLPLFGRECNRYTCKGWRKSTELNCQPFGWSSVRNSLRAIRTFFQNGGLIDESNAHPYGCLRVQTGLPTIRRYHP